MRLLRIIHLLAFLTVLPSMALLHAAESKSIQIKGSDTMVNLGQSWAEAFSGKRPEVSIAVTGGGSGTGIAAILAGTCDIAQSSRDVTAEEKAKAETAGQPLKEIIVAYDGIAVITNPANPVEKLTTAQLGDIFSGKIKNWKEVGGKDAPILMLSRERNSGTHVFFLEHIVRHGNAKGPEEFASSALMMPSSQAIAEEVKNGEAAIGYVGLGYVTQDHKIIAVGKTDSIQNVAYLVDKIKHLRIFDDDKGKMNRSVLDVKGELLVVSQFTLLGDCAKGRRPSFDEAADPQRAEELYNQFVQKLKEESLRVETGQFRAMMDVSLINDGPVTVILDSRGKACLAPTELHHD